MNSGNSKTFDPCRLLFSLEDKIFVNRSDKYVALLNLSMHYTSKNVKKSCKNNIFKISAPTWNEKFELPDGSILHQIFKIIFNISLKKHEVKTYNPSIRIYANKAEKKNYI